MKNYRELQNLSLAILMIVYISLGSCKKDEFTTDPINGQTTAIFNPEKIYGTLTDQDGNVYKTIKIGSQTWMAENLRTTKFRNGESIPKTTNYQDWIALSTPSYCNYQNINSDDSITTYGRLYNWFAVSDKRSLAPAGWHIPTRDEITVLITYIESEHLTAGALKEVGFLHWAEPNYGAGNETGFTALPGGLRSGRYGDYENIGSNGVWATSTEYSSVFIYAWIMYYAANESILSGSIYKKDGLSIRCLKND